MRRTYCSGIKNKLKKLFVAKNFITALLSTIRGNLTVLTSLAVGKAADCCILVDNNSSLLDVALTNVLAELLMLTLILFWLWSVNNYAYVHLYVQMYVLYLKVLEMDETLGTIVSNRLGMGGGFLTLLFGWLTTTNAAIFIGIIVTVSGFVMSLYFQRKRHLREIADTELRVRLLFKEDARKEELHALKIKEFEEV
jgi:hypothetical protein